jgi:hypothetical protein
VLSKNQVPALFDVYGLRISKYEKAAMSEKTNMNIEEMLRKTDSLTFLNALKVGMTELKEELVTIEEAREYQSQAVDRARKVMRRLDNQYRAVVKCVQTASETKPAVLAEFDLNHLLQQTPPKPKAPSDE